MDDGNIDLKLLWEQAKVPRVIPLNARSSASDSDRTVASVTRDGSHLADLAECFVSRILEMHGEALSFFSAQEARGGPDLWSSLCAGTDSPVHGMAYFQEGLHRHQLHGWKHCQAYVAEWSPAKREFIAIAHPDSARYRFGDVVKLSQGSSYDYISGGCVAPPRTRGKIGGFPCQDSSNLNGASKTIANRSSIASESFRAGSMFHAFVRLEVAELDSSEWSIYENVYALVEPPRDDSGAVVGPSNLDAAVYLLRTQARKFVAVLKSTPATLVL